MRLVIPLLLALCHSTDSVRNRDRKDKVADWDMGGKLSHMYFCTGGYDWATKLDVVPADNPQLFIVAEFLKIVAPLECGGNFSNYDYDGVDVKFGRWLETNKEPKKREIKECVARELVVSTKWLFCCQEYSEALLRMLTLKQPTLKVLLPAGALWPRSSILLTRSIP